MDFVINNYLWFVIGAIVLLMIIIGYFAEKTNFGKIPLNSGKNKKEITSEDESTPVNFETSGEQLKQVGIADAVAPEEPISIPEEQNDLKPEETMPEEDLNVPFGDQKVEEPTEIKPSSDAVEELPNIPEVPEANKDTSNGISDESEDDVWKF